MKYKNKIKNKKPIKLILKNYKNYEFNNLIYKYIITENI